MKVNLVQYQALASVDGATAPIGGGRLESQTITAAGDFTALNAVTQLVRIATDTAIHVRLTATGATSADELMPANSVEFFEVTGGLVVSVIAA